MRYLVFDIECCDGKHICEFGYVIANEKFEIQEKRVLLIDPDMPFNLKGRPDQADIELYYSEEEYYSSPIFPQRYDIIKELLEYDDQIVIGHAISNDIGFLRTAKKRYDLSVANFRFLDSQRAYGEFFNQKNRVSLADAEKELQLNKPEYLHKSDDDAKLTLELIQSICCQLEVTVQQLMELCPTACGRSEKFFCCYNGSGYKDMLDIINRDPDRLSNKKKKECFYKFLQKVRPNGKIPDHILNDKTVVFSVSIENRGWRERFVMAQMLADVGCKYSSKISQCDYYVASDDELHQTEVPVRSRYYAATQGDFSAKVKVIRLEELLDILGVSEEEIRKKEIVINRTKNNGAKEKKSNNNIVYSSGNSTSTVGEQLKAKGIDLVALFK